GDVGQQRLVPAPHLVPVDAVHGRVVKAELHHPPALLEDFFAAGAVVDLDRGREVDPPGRPGLAPAAARGARLRGRGPAAGAALDAGGDEGDRTAVGGHGQGEDGVAAAGQLAGTAVEAVEVDLHLGLGRGLAVGPAARAARRLAVGGLGRGLAVHAAIGRVLL